MAFLCFDCGRDRTQGTVPSSYTPQSVTLTALLRFTIHILHPLNVSNSLLLVFSQLISFYKEIKLALSMFLNVLNNTVLNVLSLSFLL